MVDGGTRYSSSLPPSLPLSLFRRSSLSPRISLVSTRVYTPAPHRHACTLLREGRKCTRITPGDAGGAEDVERQAAITAVTGASGTPSFGDEDDHRDKRPILIYQH